MNRPNPLPFAALLTLAFATQAAYAATRHFSIPAGKLTVSAPCARMVTIEPDPAANGSISADATAAHDEEISELVLAGGETPTLRGPQDQCWRPAFALDFRSTMDIVVRVPPHTPLSIEESGQAQYRIGNIGGPLNLSLSGAVTLDALGATTLDAELSGSGRVTVTRVSGNLHGDLSGSSDLVVTRGDMEQASLDLSGSGGFQLAGGTIGHLKLSISGSADVTIGGTVGDAEAEISGSSRTRIAKLTGRLTKDISGSGDVIIGEK